MHTSPVEYHIQATFPSSSDLVTTQSRPYHTTAEYSSLTGSEADIGITVEHVNQPRGTCYNVQAGHSLSSLVRPVLYIVSFKPLSPDLETRSLFRWLFVFGNSSRLLLTA